MTEIASLAKKNLFTEWEHPHMSVGTDPELFVVDKKDKLIPAFKFLPEKNDAKRSNVHQYWDGFQAEFDFSSPYQCLEEMAWDIQASLGSILERAREHDKHAKLSIQNVFELSKEVLDTAETHQVELGCKPSFNIYDDKGERVANPRKLMHRFAGGHMHFSLKDGRDVPDYGKSVHALDSVLGIWSVGAAASLDNPIRRKYYGLAGEYRKPIYRSDGWEGQRRTFGIEYRTLSNFWLCHPAIYHLTWDIGRLAIWFADSEFFKYWVVTPEEIRETINNCDVKQARKIMERNKGVFRWLMTHKRGDWEKPWGIRHVNRAFDISIEGVERLVKDPTEIEKNWQVLEYGREEASQHDLHTFYTAVGGDD